ncbi:MAG: GatB/YqeY domain-containing protein [Candidatus Cloacimonetes bacterium]|nr:GatB/YqeY domain-containing protein [Candidatus Cloacimonadota bacterium]
MSLKARVQEDMKTFMKNKDSASLTVVRMLWSALRKEEIDSRTDLSDEGIQSIILKMIKQREETLTFLRQDNRVEQIETNESEIRFLKGYLPEQMSEDKVKSLVMEAKANLGASTAKDTGKMMGTLIPQLKGKCDPSLLARLVKEALNAN